MTNKEMRDYICDIRSIDEKERWIFISDNNENDLEEPASFVILVKRICNHVTGEF